MKMVKVRKKVKIFLESVFKTVFYVKRAPLNSYVGSLTIPLICTDDNKENSLCYDNLCSHESMHIIE